MERPAAHTLVKYFKKQATPEECRAIAAWRGQSARNARTLGTMRAIWERHGDRHGAFQPDTAAAWRHVASRIAGQRPGRAWRARYAVAAAVIVGLGIGWLAVTLAWHGTPMGSRGATQLVAAGGAAAHTLPDGSMVTLRQGAKAEYKAGFGSGHRRLRLVGEAHFAVAHHKALPFVVTAGQAEATVLGTEFSVTKTDKTVVLAVASGQVAFKGHGAQAIVVSPGEQATYARQAGRIDKSPIRSANHWSWKTGILVFEETPLSAIAQDLAAHYKVAIGVSPVAGAYRVTATFHRQSLAEVLAIIAETVPATAKKTSHNSYYIH